MYGYGDYGYGGNVLSDLIEYSDSSLVFMGIGLVLGILVFALFMPKRKRKQYLRSPSLLLTYDFLHFKKMISMWFVKLSYVIIACIITVMSVVFLFTVNFLTGLITLIVGNLVWRVVYEIIIVLFSIHENLNILTDKLTDRTPEEMHDIGMGEFFGDMGSKIKQQQEKLRAHTDASQQDVTFCSGCGQPLTPTEKFCPKCGTKTQPEQ